MYQLASIVESSGDAILGKTLQGVITSWNSSAVKLFGYTADEAIGTSISLIIPPDRQEELPQILARITEGEIVQHYETTRMRKDGTHIEVSVTVSPIRDPKGRIIAASTITHDISEQKRMVEELIALNSALKAMELAQALHPCAIMLDVMMPALNGWQILHQLKENPATASIPVMLITVLTEPTTGYVLGADAYLIKPFKTNVLLNTLRNLLASQKGHSQAAEREAQRA